ncbi:DUF6948 domain-containing protein [Rhizobium alvei]|uniref:DUF6948 domain-containing protein n=1 Tax=Rhizobium alvei TaxID=1132659 RepID=A0ABT8YT47_9HYPH|nr:hypothetical protein [Rhizobium alvei]MDO6966946.1 hypothetical protein [Rhizobium alvei]
MDINELTIGQAKELAAMFGAATQQASGTFTPHIGKRCIIRTYASGVFFGEVAAQDGRMVEIKNCRRLWSWKAKEGISLSAVATNGVSGSTNKFSPTVPTQTVLDALEIIPASDAAIASIDAIKDAVQS